MQVAENLEFLRPFVNEKVSDNMFNYEKLTRHIVNKPISGLLKIALVGAGGKTTAMYALGQFFKAQGKRVVVSTTTKVFRPGEEDVDRACFAEDFSTCLLNDQGKDAYTVFIGKSYDEMDKVTGFEPHEVQLETHDSVDVLIYEADGAKRRSIKAPREDEPRLIEGTDIVIGVIGLDVLEKPACQAYVHRLDLFKDLVHIEENEKITSRHIGMLVRHPRGLFKDVSDSTHKILLLTKMDDEARTLLALAVQETLQDWEGDIIAI